MIGTYQLARHIASYEFYYWMVMVQSYGVSKICFDVSSPKTRKFTHSDVMGRFYSIIEPGPAFAGLKYFYDRRDVTVDAVAAQLPDWYKAGQRFKRLQSVKPAVKCDYTVTIRQNKAGAKGRDSNRVVWEEFARRIGATVIDDWYVKPIHMHDRIALYAGAKMNYGVCNGPIAMTTLTEYPVAMVINTESARNATMRWGTQVGEKLPWMLPNQHHIWQDDDSVASLLRIHESIAV